jgi:hypothetical protein
MQTKSGAVGRVARRKWFAPGSIQFDCGSLLRDIELEGRERGGRLSDEFAAARIWRHPGLSG